MLPYTYVNNSEKQGTVRRMTSLLSEDSGVKVPLLGKAGRTGSVES